MGTADFAVPSLNAILEAGYNVVGVITAPDKPAGRGRKLRTSPVKNFASKNNLNILQPTNLKDPRFIAELTDLKPDLQVVVAFRMLPEVVWKLPIMGTFNLHSSLLPQYRGAAPINHAVMNGETKTGVTTFLIDEKIDTGRIIDQKETLIGENETAGELHDKLMEIGSHLVVSTIEKITVGNYNAIDQKSATELKPAPKIFKEDCKIDWNLPVEKVHNFIRGLSPFPGAYTFIYYKESNKTVQLKILQSKINDNSDIALKPGEISIPDKESLLIGCDNGNIQVIELQPEGKKRMLTPSFLRGYNLPNFIKPD